MGSRNRDNKEIQRTQVTELFKIMIKFIAVLWSCSFVADRTRCPKGLGWTDSPVYATRITSYLFDPFLSESNKHTNPTTIKLLQLSVIDLLPTI